MYRNAIRRRSHWKIWRKWSYLATTRRYCELMIIMHIDNTDWYMAMVGDWVVSSLRWFKSPIPFKKKATASHMLTTWMIVIWHPPFPPDFSLLFIVSTSCPDRVLVCLCVWFCASNVYLLPTILLPPSLHRFHDGRLLLGSSSWFGNGLPIVDVGWMLLLWMRYWRRKWFSRCGSSLLDSCCLLYQVYETQCLATKKDGRKGSEGSRGSEGSEKGWWRSII